MDSPSSSSASSSPTESEHPISNEPLAQSDQWVIKLPEDGEVITSLATRNSYTMGAKIGEGAFGIVYQCSDGWRNDLAAKVMKQRGIYEQARQAAEAEFLKLVHLRHPYITYIFDAFEYRQTFYIITERCWCPLTHLMTIQNFDGMVWIKPIARCLLQAVSFLHTNGYAHQDIHLGNVFAAFAKDELATDDIGSIQFRLGDLGVAKLISEIDAANTRAQWMLPPEVLDTSQFGPIDHRSDIYHCGLLFLSIAHGIELQFTLEEILAGRPRDMALELRPPFSFALEKALRRHVMFRTETALELWRDLNSPGAAEALQPGSETST
jgi:eukaryotic-like serine/threonine-protein kinase